MLQLCRNEKEKVLEMIKNGTIDSAEVGLPNLIDSIILTMKKKGFLDGLEHHLPDRRQPNKHIPLSILITLFITAKLKIKTSLTDVPFAVTDPVLLAELGFSLWDSGRNLEDGLFSEGVARKLLAKYESSEFVSFYNQYIQKSLLPAAGFLPDIHILDCTNIPVNLSNDNYEGSSVVTVDGETTRGYKLGVLRGCLDNSGIAEEIVFGTLKTHDLEICRKMMLETPCLKEGDILINDRGFLSREMVNELKHGRKVDVFIPARANMIIYQDAVQIAGPPEGKGWQKHPNKKRKNQVVQLVTDLGALWRSETPENDVPINACVVYDKKTEEYFVFMTTDCSLTARQIISVYEMRPEIEEDFRQMKDFWKLTDFKSTKYSYITCHIVMTLLGYAYFQIYKNVEEGRRYQRKSLPVAMKNHVDRSAPKAVIIYSGQYFGIFKFLEFIQLYAECTAEVRKLLDPVLALV